jgi:hypothetical protein
VVSNPKHKKRLKSKLRVAVKVLSRKVKEAEEERKRGGKMKTNGKKKRRNIVARWKTRLILRSRKIISKANY